ncbi:hypothetical protein ACFL2V_05075 [Pseudomonadota bacterium]
MKRKRIVYPVTSALFLLASSAQAEIISPMPNTALDSDTVAFHWKDIGETKTYITVKRDNPDYGQVLHSNLSVKTEGDKYITVSELPNDGTPLYVTTAQEIPNPVPGYPNNKRWEYNTFAYTSNNPGPIAPVMISPVDYSILDSTSVTFQWEDLGASHHDVMVGSTFAGAGGPNIVSYAHDIHNTENSITVNNLPTDGSAVYIRLSSYFNGTWTQRDFHYTSAR